MEYLLLGRSRVGVDIFRPESELESSRLKIFDSVALVRMMKLAACEMKMAQCCIRMIICEAHYWKAMNLAGTCDFSVLDEIRWGDVPPLRVSKVSVVKLSVKKPSDCFR